MENNQEKTIAENFRSSSNWWNGGAGLGICNFRFMGEESRHGPTFKNGISRRDLPYNGTWDAFHDIGNETKRRKEYLHFVEEALEEDDDAFLDLLNSSSKACGSEAFRRTVEERLKNKAASLDRYVDVSMRKPELGTAASRDAQVERHSFG